MIRAVSDDQRGRTEPRERPRPSGGEAPPDEEELQRRLEEQLRRVRVQDLLLESVASILNLSARRIAKADERDLEQARVGIEAVRALLDLIEPEAARAGPRGALAGADALRARGGGGGDGRGSGGRRGRASGPRRRRPGAERPGSLDAAGRLDTATAWPSAGRDPLHCARFAAGRPGRF